MFLGHLVNHMTRRKLDSYLITYKNQLKCIKDNCKRLTVIQIQENTRGVNFHDPRLVDYMTLKA